MRAKATFSAPPAWAAHKAEESSSRSSAPTSRSFATSVREPIAPTARSLSVGTTLSGGCGDNGGVYAFSGGSERVHTFCSEANCTDGDEPLGGLITDAAGNLYGTTGYGGTNGVTNVGGTVFELEI